MFKWILKTLKSRGVAGLMELHRNLSFSITRPLFSAKSGIKQKIEVNWGWFIGGASTDFTGEPFSARSADYPMSNDSGSSVALKLTGHHFRWASGVKKRGSGRRREAGCRFLGCLPIVEKGRWGRAVWLHWWFAGRPTIKHGSRQWGVERRWWFGGWKLAGWTISLAGADWAAGKEGEEEEWCGGRSPFAGAPTVMIQRGTGACACIFLVYYGCICVFLLGLREEKEGRKYEEWKVLLSLFLNCWDIY